MREWQVGDSREEALAEYVTEHARPGDLDDAIRVIDEFCYRKGVLINIGEGKDPGSIHPTDTARALEATV
jgi:hypothetical protein